MFKKTLEWAGQNKLATILIFLFLMWALPNFFGVSSLLSRKQMMGSNFGYGTDAINPSFSMGAKRASYDAVSSSEMMPSEPSLMPSPYPPVETGDRKVITQGYMSIHVENVSQTIEKVKGTLSEIGGYVVNVNLSRPEFGENATLTARVPAEQMENFLAFVRGNAVKVVSEDLNGSDITDQYVDSEARLDQITKEKLMLEAILAKAVTVEDIMRVRPYIQQLQNEIDEIKGSLIYMDGASKTSLVTIYMSTDELSLPTTETLAWRPAVIMKAAYRSLLGTLMKLGTIGIWLGVYSLLIIPAFTIGFIIYLAAKRKR